MAGRKPELSLAEMQQFRSGVETLERGATGRSWRRGQISEALGFRSISALSTIMNTPDVSTSKIRYEALMQLIRDNREPGSVVLTPEEADKAMRAPTKPSRRRPTRRRRVDMIPDDRVAVARDIFERLKDVGYTPEDVARQGGYRNAASLYQAFSRRRVPTEVFERLKRFAESEEVRIRASAAGKMPPVLPITERKPEGRLRSPTSLTSADTTIDFVKAALRHYQEGNEILRRGIEGQTFKRILVPGIEKAKLGIERHMLELEEILR